MPHHISGFTALNGTEKVMDVVPQAIYIHCFAHILNLVLLTVLKIFTTQVILSFFESPYVSIPPSKLMLSSSELYPSEPDRVLKMF